MDAEERPIVGTTMLGHALVHTYELSIPVLIPLWGVAFDATASELGVLVAVGYSLLGFGALPSGVLADRFGARRVIAGCFAGMSAAFLLVAAAPTWYSLGLALALWGLAASAYHPSGLALLTRQVSQRGRALGYHGVAGNVGIALGPFVTLLLLLWLDWRTVAMLLALPSAVAAPLVWRLDVADGYDPTRNVSAGGEVRRVLAESRTLFAGGFSLVFLLVVLEGTYYRGVLTFMPELLDSLSGLEPVRFVGREIRPGRYLYVVMLLVGVTGQYVGGRLSDRIPVEYGVALAFVGLAVVPVLIVPAATAGLVPFVGLTAILGFLLFAEQPFLQATAATYSDASVRGVSYGFMYVGVFGVGAVGAAASGAALTYAGVETLFLLIAAVAVVAVVAAAYLHYRGPGQDAR